MLLYRHASTQKHMIPTLPSHRVIQGYQYFSKVNVLYNQESYNV